MESKFGIKIKNVNYEVRCPKETPFKYVCMMAASKCKIRKIFPSVDTEKSAREVFLRHGDEFELEVEIWKFFVNSFDDEPDGVRAEHSGTDTAGEGLIPTGPFPGMPKNSRHISAVSAGPQTRQPGLQGRRQGVPAVPHGQEPDGQGHTGESGLHGPGQSQRRPEIPRRRKRRGSPERQESARRGVRGGQAITQRPRRLAKTEHPRRRHLVFR